MARANTAEDDKDFDEICQVVVCILCTIKLWRIDAYITVYKAVDSHYYFLYYSTAFMQSENKSHAMIHQTVRRFVANFSKRYHSSIF